MRLYGRALREGWPVGPAERALAVHEALTILRTCHSDQRKLGAIKALIQADAVNVSRERIRSQEKTTGDRTQVEAVKALLAALSPTELAELNRRTLCGLSAPEPSQAPPPGGLLPAQQGGEGVQPPPADTSFQNRPAKLA